MSRQTQKVEETVTFDLSERLIDAITGSKSGPIIIVLGGMHGNEQAGVQALQQVFKKLKEQNTDFHGELWGIRANTKALKKGVRFIDEDLNRLWFPSIIRSIRKTPAEELASSERRELKQLLRLLDKIIPYNSTRSVVVADLHSFSGEGSIFTITAKKEKHIRLLSSLHAPMIFGIENALQGTVLRYYQDLGYITFAFEGGQHQDEVTIQNNMAAIFLLLKSLGSVSSGAVPEMSSFDRQLKQATRGIPAQVELIYQHIIEPDDGFEMLPGFKNFDSVKKGDWLATDSQGKIRAEYDGYILMPLYQEQGNDGFFIVREHHS